MTYFYSFLTFQLFVVMLWNVWPSAIDRVSLGTLHENQVREVRKDFRCVMVSKLHPFFLTSV